MTAFLTAVRGEAVQGCGLPGFRDREAWMNDPAGSVQAISDEELAHFRRYIYDHAGIALAPQKRHLVAGRLQKRLLHYGLRTYGLTFALFPRPRRARNGRSWWTC